MWGKFRRESVAEKWRERRRERERERETHTHRIIIKLPADNLVHS